MRRAFGLAVAVSVGFWLDEALRLIYRRTQHAPARRPHLARVVPITEGRLHP